MIAPSKLALLLSAAALLVGSGPTQAGERPRAGRWEVTVEVQAAGMALPPTSQAECFTQEQLEAPPVTDVDKGSCHARGIRRTGDRITWELDCGELGSGAGELTYSGASSYEGSMTLKSGGGDVRARIRAHRIGDC